MKNVGRWIGVGVAIILIIAIAFVVEASLFPSFREISRDIAIIILAVFQLTVSFLLIVLLLGVLYALKETNRLTRDLIIPKIDATVVKVDEILENTRAITSSIRSSADTTATTTTFVAEQVATPIIRISSLVTGVRAAAGALARRGNGTEESLPE